MLSHIMSTHIMSKKDDTYMYMYTQTVIKIYTCRNVVKSEGYSLQNRVVI